MVQTGVPSSAGNGLHPIDSDNDSQPNFQDLDSDNDAVSDLIEGGFRLNDIGNDGVLIGEDGDQDGILNIVDKNTGIFGSAWTIQNSDYRVPDFLDPDRDEPRDYIIGNADGIEDDIDMANQSHLDIDNNGLIDDPTDSDNDGIADVVDHKPNVFGGLSELDTDQDGIVNIVDIDDDNDGILDTDEDGRYRKAPLDSDGDGFLNSLDLDSDDDGINDVIEAGGIDSNNDGLADGSINSNGLPFSASPGLKFRDLDKDNRPDFLDLDSDND